jgi:hypothetical protein
MSTAALQYLVEHEAPPPREAFFLREVERPRCVLPAKTRQAFAAIYKACDAFIVALDDEGQRRDLARRAASYNSSVGEIHFALERLPEGPESKLARKLYHRVAHSFENGSWWGRIDPVRLSEVMLSTKAKWQEIESLLAGQRLLFPESAQ